MTARGIARTYQNIHLFAGMTVLENVMVGSHANLLASPLGAMLRPPVNVLEEDAALEKAYLLLEFIGLGEEGDTLATNLPYGSQRRLEIARALASDPKLLLLDEPTAGMNPHETEDTMRFIRRLRDERDLTILLIEHDMRVVMNISDQVSVLDYGRKIAEGTPEEVRTTRWSSKPIWARRLKSLLPVFWKPNATGRPSWRYSKSLTCIPTTAKSMPSRASR